MIAIKMRGDKFRLAITEEELEFNTQDDMQKILNYLLELKKKYGKLKNE